MMTGRPDLISSNKVIPIFRNIYLLPENEAALNHVLHSFIAPEISTYVEGEITEISLIYEIIVDKTYLASGMETRSRIGCLLAATCPC